MPFKETPATGGCARPEDPCTWQLSSFLLLCILLILFLRPLSFLSFREVLSSCLILGVCIYSKTCPLPFFAVCQFGRGRGGTTAYHAGGSE